MVTDLCILPYISQLTARDFGSRCNHCGNGVCIGQSSDVDMLAVDVFDE
jgi:hypothetical protein